MRNSFDAQKTSRGHSDWNDGFTPYDQASSPDQIAVLWNNSGELVAASPAASDVPGSFDMDITRLPVEFDLQVALNMRRENNLGVPPLSAQTLYLTVVPSFNERTRILALDGNILALNDDELAEWLIEAERQMTLGTDNHPIFENALQDSACAISRLPNGRVAMTEVPRQFIEATRDKIRSLAGNSVSTNLQLIVETPLRCAARYFLTALPEGGSALRPEKESEVTAFLLITKSGFNYGLWSPSAGLFSEYGFLSPMGVNQQGNDFYKYGSAAYGRRAGGVQIVEAPSSDDAPENEGEFDEQNLDAYIRHAFDQLFLQLSPEKLAQLQLSAYSQVVWAAETGLSETVAALAHEYSERTGLDFFQISFPVDEAVAGGLLFGSFNFGDETVAGAEILPPINLAHDLLVLADTEEIEQRRIEEVYLQKRRNRAILTLVAVPVIVSAALLAIVLDIVRTQSMLAWREASADARTAELKPALDRRRAYEANLVWYQEFIKQVSFLRRQQPVGTGMLYELNPSYPFNTDPSFYISELKLLPTGGVEIKGLARNKDAVTSFLRSLEFSGGSQSGSKLFSNLTYEVQEGVAQQAAATTQPSLPTIAGSNLGATKPAPGIISWSIKGNYLPVAEFLPPEPKKGPAVVQPNPAAPNQPNPAVNNPAVNNPPVTTAPKSNP
jgi:Tfp pilus assembly protein PilN